MAVVGIPAVLGLVYVGGWALAAPLAAFSAWGGHEVFRMAERKGLQPVEPVGVALAGGLVLLAAWRPDFEAFAPAALAALLVGGLLVMLEALRSRGPTGTPLASMSVTLFGAGYVGGTLAFVLFLRGLPGTRAFPTPDGSGWAGLAVVALPLAATWIGDAAAYFAGTAWGKDRRRLAPSISPNKSWVGFWAALAGAGLAAWLWSLIAARAFAVLYPTHWVVAGGVLLGAAAVVGDLAESLLKREAGVKDSGAFFPGHGGVLDRIDSLTFTIPLSYVLLVLGGGLG